MSAEKIDIVFESILYPAKANKPFDPILKSIDGKFSSGQLTAILGRCGAGKTTLLNVLGGQICKNLKGVVKINGTRMDPKKFKRKSSYLGQDVLLQQYLTVKEYMMISADLLLGGDATNRLKEEIIGSILKSLSMQNLLDTRTEHLSGGERKRLSIAIELINDPQVILLDEPTSGLDNVAANECVEILKNLASKGKTVICSIHQPSNSILKMFDRLYVLNDGNCIYDGAIHELVPFLEDCGCPCPKTHNPADYVLELDEETYEMLKNRTSSVWNDRRRSIEETYSKEDRQQETDGDGFERLLDRTLVLLRKNFIQMRRKKTSLVINVLQHIVCSLASALITINNGNNAERAFDNFKFIFGTCVFFLLSYMTVPILSVPATVKMIKQEIRNGWYTPFPYLVAEIITVLPTMIVLPTMFATIVFSLLFIEINIKMISLVSVIFILTAFISHLFGLCLGTSISAKNGAIIGPITGALKCVISVAGLGGGKIPPFLEGLRQFSFLRYSWVGVALASYGDRQKLDCSEIFCPHANVQRFIKDVGFEGSRYSDQVMVLSIVAMAFTLAYYLVLRVRFVTHTGKSLKRFR